MHRWIVAALVLLPGVMALGSQPEPVGALPPTGEWATCVSMGWESNCAVYVLYDENGTAVNSVVGGPDLADGRWNCAALGADGCAASVVRAVQPEYVSTTSSSTTTTSSTVAAPSPPAGSMPAPDTTVAPEPVRCPTALCGYAVIDDDGNVYGVIVCSDACTGQRMTQSYMGCPAGCRMVVQGQQTADGNVAGWHGQDVRYDERSRSFELPSGGSLRSGARLEDAVFPTTTAPPSSGDDGEDGGPAAITGFVAPGGVAYSSAAEFVSGESTVSVTDDQVVIGVPILPVGDLGYEATFEPSDGGASALVESGRIVGGEVREDGVAAALASVRRRTARWTVSVDRSRLPAADGRLTLVLFRGSQRYAEVGAHVATARRFPGCAALLRRYPGGVAVGTIAAERIVLARAASRFGRPLANAGLYALNRRLDADRDGVACERAR